MTKPRNNTNNDLQPFIKALKEQASNADDAYAEAIALNKKPHEIDQAAKVRDATKATLDIFLGIPKPDPNLLAMQTVTNRAISAKLIIEFITNLPIMSFLKSPQPDQVKFLQSQDPQQRTAINQLLKTLKEEYGHVAVSKIQELGSTKNNAKIEESIQNLSDKINSINGLQKGLVSFAKSVGHGTEMKADPDGPKTPGMRH